jgi:hypothetical protein
VPSSPVPYLFTQFGLDSGALTLLGQVVHQFDAPGEYRGTAVIADAPEATFYLTVEETSAATQVHVDLAALAEASAAASGCSCGKNHGGPSSGHFFVGAKGYALFHVSGGAGGHAVRIVGAGKSEVEFDSTKLGKGDLFVATILRPGRYAVKNLLEAAAAPGELDVAYPVGGATPYRPGEPARVACTRSGFRPANVALTAAQACVFSCEAPARIKIELIAALDPPAATQPTRRRSLRRPG